MSAALAAACDGAMTIPMYGLTESLNVSVAAALAIHYGRVARAKALGAERLNAAGGDMSAAEVEAPWPSTPPSAAASSSGAATWRSSRWSRGSVYTQF